MESNTNDRLRVLVVDDTVTYRKIVSDVLAEIPFVEVVGVAAHGEIALRKVDHLRPDLLTLDLEMPELDGLGVLSALRKRGGGVGAIMLSAFTSKGAQSTLEALELGAFDFVTKPTGVDMAANTAELRGQLRGKIEAFARSRKKLVTPREQAATSRPATVSRATPPAAARTGPVDAVCLGISTGGPQALSQMMPKLPGNLGRPMFIVQHMPPLFTKSLAESLNAKCALTVCEAEQGQVVQPNFAYIAPGGKQMKVERKAGGVVININDDPPENNCRPAVDYLFRSVGTVYGGNVVGVIMTGMGSDGTLGCKLLKRRGATIVLQDQGSCVVYGMPKVAADEGLGDVIAPLGDIAGEISRLTRVKESVSV